MYSSKTGFLEHLKGKVKESKKRLLSKTALIGQGSFCSQFINDKLFYKCLDDILLSKKHF